jgi:hypothetical protein
VSAQVAFLDAVDEDTRRYIAAHFEPAEWAAKVEWFKRWPFFPGTQEDGTPICLFGDREAHLGWVREQRAAERVGAVHDDGHAAALASQIADTVERRGGTAAPRLRRRADRLSRRARLQRVRSVLRSAIARRVVRPRARGRRAASARRRNGVRSSRAADPSPGEPDPAEGRDERSAP